MWRAYSGHIALIFPQASDLRDDMYLDALNSLLVSGEYPPLFSEDELDSLLQVSNFTCAMLGHPVNSLFV